MESSSPIKINDKARLLSPYFPATTGGLCFEIWYHMWGVAGYNRKHWSTNYNYHLIPIDHNFVVLHGVLLIPHVLIGRYSCLCTVVTVYILHYKTFVSLMNMYMFQLS